MLNFWKPTFTQVNILAQNDCPGLLMIAFVTLGETMVTKVLLLETIAADWSGQEGKAGYLWL